MLMPAARPWPDRLGHFQVLREYVADLEISEDQPWMLQQLLQGTEFSSYSVAHEGHLILHCDTVARASNLRYADVGDRQVRGPVILALLTTVDLQARLYMLQTLRAQTGLIAHPATKLDQHVERLPRMPCSAQGTVSSHSTAERLSAGRSWHCVLLSGCLS